MRFLMSPWGLIAFGALAGCAQPQPLDRGEFDFARTLSRVDDIHTEFSQDALVTLQNKDFESPRRIERALTEDFASTNATKDVLEGIAQKTLRENFPSEEFKLLHIDQGTPFNYATFQQMVGAREVVGSRLVIRLSSAAEWMTMSSTLVPATKLASLHSLESLAVKTLRSENFFTRAHHLIRERSVIYPRLENDGTLKVYAAREFGIYDQESQSEFVFWVDEETEQTIGGFQPSSHFDSLRISGNIALNQPGGITEDVLFPSITVKDNHGNQVMTQPDGSVDIRSLEGPELQVALDNETVVVLNDDSGKRAMSININDLKEAQVSLNAGLSDEERNIFHWVMHTKRFLKEKFNFDRASSKLTAIARFGEDLDNAFFMPLTYQLAFGTGKNFLKNTGLSRDVIIHEFGHSVVYEKYGMVGGYEFSAMNEAMADFLAATITEDPLIGEGVMHERTGMKYLRTVDNAFHYKTFGRGKNFHNDGQMFSGALWNLRKMLGKDIVDPMIHEAQLAQAKTVHEFYRELLIIDERNDDGNPWTASPHEAQIRQAFRVHGLGARDVILAEANPEDLTEDWKKGCWSVN